jgi:hypothetical protein
MRKTIVSFALVLMAFMGMNTYSMKTPPSISSQIAEKLAAAKLKELKPSCGFLTASFPENSVEFELQRTIKTQDREELKLLLHKNNIPEQHHWSWVALMFTKNPVLSNSDPLS